MKRSRTEVGRWRMLRQVSRRKARWLEAQSRRNMAYPRHQKMWIEQAPQRVAVRRPGYLKTLRAPQGAR